MRKDIKNMYLVRLLGYSKLLDKAFEYHKDPQIDKDLYDALCCKKSLIKFVCEITGANEDHGFFKYDE